MGLSTLTVQEEGLESSLKAAFGAAGVTGLGSERLKLDLLTANELKILLKERRLKVSGNKAELIERLLQHSHDQRKAANTDSTSDSAKEERAN